MPILAAENESKGDSGPDVWKPPSHGAWCLYTTVWDHIKAKWHLTATSSERAALDEWRQRADHPEGAQMSVDRPFYRTARQFSDGEYNEGGRWEYVDHHTHEQPERLRACLLDDPG